jgi:hypothetical protein
MKRWRLWRLRRAYRRIAKLEVKVPFDEGGRLRQAFARDTLKVIDAVGRGKGYPRRVRRTLKRELIR